MLPKPASLRRLGESLARQEEQWKEEVRALPLPARAALANRLSKAGLVAVARADQAWDEGQVSRALQNRTTARMLEAFANQLCDL